MPGIRERGPNHKIKGKAKGGKPSQRDARRQLTAKFRKELAQRDRGGAEESPDTQAVEQSEEYSAAIVEEVAVGAKWGSSKLSSIQRGISGEPPSDVPPSTAGPYSAADTPPPLEPMRQKFLEERREQAARQHQLPGVQTESQTSITSYYGKTALPSETTKERVSLENLSIHPSIKERPRRSAVSPKEKPADGAFSPKTRKQMEQGAKQAAAAHKATAKVVPTAEQVTERARRRFRRQTQQKMLQKTQQTARRAADLSRRTVLATAKAVRALIGALTALFGGGVLLTTLCIIILLAAVIASPFGILFSNEPSRDAVPLNAAISQVNMELTDYLADLQDGDYDTINLQGQPPDWREVVAVFAAKTAGADDGVDVASLTPDRVDRLKTVFWDMCTVSASTESIHHPATDTTEAWTEHILTIAITANTAEEMRTTYIFNDLQNTALTELLDEMDTLGLMLEDLSISQQSAIDLYRSLPADLSPERRAVLQAACSLVGKVNYFWGGKSLVLGWDSRWGTIQRVWAEDSPTTGTYRPYGLDCSGFVDWVFYNATDGEYIIGHGGGAASQHTYCTAISWNDAIPGDLVFYPGDEHVGIVCGRDEDGNLLIVHCASGTNNVVITGADGFTSIARPLFYHE